MIPAAGLSRGLAAIAALALVCVCLPALAAPSFPALSGRRVVDDAGILSPAVEASLTRTLDDLQTATGREMVVATLPSLQGYEIEDYGHRLGRAWGVGSADRNDGVLLIVAPKERKVRIEVGYGLEGVLTDALASAIVHRTILPKFREGDLQGGVISGTDAIVGQLRLPDDEAQAIAGKARAKGGRRETAWWIRPVIGFAVTMVITVIIPFFWSIFSGFFGGWGGPSPARNPPAAKWAGRLERRQFRWRLQLRRRILGRRRLIRRRRRVRELVSP